MQKYVTFAEKNLKKLAKSNSYWKVKDPCHYTGRYRCPAHSIYKLKFNVFNEIPVVFYNGSNYDYYFIIKKISKQLWGTNCNVLGKTQKNIKHFRFQNICKTVPVEKEIKRIDKARNESVVT